MTIFAIAISSNLDKQHNMQSALHKLEGLGPCQFSAIYQIPCRDGVGADYWNSACLLVCNLSCVDIMTYLKQLEMQSGRKRPSHSISLDMDLIAWGKDMQHMQFNSKKLPLAEDVIIPLSELWHHVLLQSKRHHYQRLVL